MKQRFLYIIVSLFSFTVVTYAQDAPITTTWAKLTSEDSVTVYISIESGAGFTVTNAHAHPAKTAEFTEDEGEYTVILSGFEEEPAISDALNIMLTFEMDGDEENTMQMAVGALIMEKESKEAPIAIHNAWARPTISHDADPEDIAMPPMSPSAVYMLITNLNEDDDKLINASTDIAMIVEIHEVKMENEVMRMRPVEGGIDLPVNELVELKPGGYHIMLMDIYKNMVTGDAFSLTLYFESGTEITIAVPVYDAMELEMMGEHSDAHNHGDHHQNDN